MNLTAHTNRHLTLTLLQLAFNLHSVSVIFATSCETNTITTVVTTYFSNPTNTTLTTNGPTWLHPLSLGQVEGSPGNSVWCRHKRRVLAVAKWLWLLKIDGRERRWLRASSNIWTVWICVNILPHPTCRITPSHWITPSHDKQIES